MNWRIFSENINYQSQFKKNKNITPEQTKKKTHTHTKICKRDYLIEVDIQMRSSKTSWESYYLNNFIAHTHACICARTRAHTPLWPKFIHEYMWGKILSELLAVQIQENAKESKHHGQVCSPRNRITLQ